MAVQLWKSVGGLRTSSTLPRQTRLEVGTLMDEERWKFNPDCVNCGVKIREIGWKPRCWEHINGRRECWPPLVATPKKRVLSPVEESIYAREARMIGEGMSAHILERGT